MNKKTYNILFLCTGNSARSIMAEGLMNALSQGRFKAFSAGSYPKGQVHPMALEKLKESRYPIKNFRSKSWDEFAAPDAPKMDFVITVCDKAAGEVCPVWPGQPISAHWGFPDPAEAEGSDMQKRAAFQRAFTEIGNRVRIFLSLPFDKLDRIALQSEIRALGKTSA